jgi:SPP1 gp7 family putative phage head morphogenesis protein
MNKESLDKKLEEFESEILEIVSRQLMPSAINSSSAASLQRNLNDASSQQYQDFYNSLDLSLSRLYDSFDLGTMSRKSSIYYSTEIKEYLDIFHNVLEFSKKTTIDYIINTLSSGAEPNKLMDSAAEVIKGRNNVLGNYLSENSRLFNDYMLLWEGEADGNKYYKFISENINACSVCSDLNGKVFIICDASIGNNMPPIHPNCRCDIDVLDENKNQAENVPESHSENLFDTSNIVLNTPSIIDWQKYMPSDSGITDIPPEIITVDINAEIIALITSELPNSSGRYSAIADINSFWYDDDFNGIERRQCPWFVKGRIGEIYGVEITFDGSGNGGLWAQNAEEKAYIWRDGEKTDEYRTIHRETEDFNKIVLQSAASFKDPEPWGHVVFIEAIEKIDEQMWIYYSDDWKLGNGGHEGRIRKVLFEDFINLHGGLVGYVHIE